MELEREIQHYKNANSKALKQIVFNQNWNLLLRDKFVNQKVILFTNMLIHIFRTFIRDKIIECDFIHPSWMTLLALSRLKNVTGMANLIVA